MKPLHRASLLLPALLWCALLGTLGGCAHRGDHATSAAAPAAALAAAGQLIVVSSDGWDADHGQLQAYERRAGRWVAIDAPAAVMLGRSGVAWGLGLHDAQPGPQKREGDGRAPAGVFAIGTTFGYAASAGTAMPYAQMRASSWCIDVPASPLYNQVVDADVVGSAAVQGSTEPMRRDLHHDGDVRYTQGFVILHNAQAVPGAGSCIFAHLWRAPGDATAGCTAMDPAVMQRLLAWLDPGRKPLFVLLPRSESERLQASWGLPAASR